jgi:hypothetical protein
MFHRLNNVMDVIELHSLSKAMGPSVSDLSTPYL